MVDNGHFSAQSTTHVDNMPKHVRKNNGGMRFDIDDCHVEGLSANDVVDALTRLDVGVPVFLTGLHVWCDDSNAFRIRTVKVSLNESLDGANQ